jgi:hypothetical protein
VRVILFGANGMIGQGVLIALLPNAYAVLRPVVPLLRRLFPGAIITTEELGRAMLRVGRDGYPTRALETRDLRIAAGAAR